MFGSDKNSREKNIVRAGIVGIVTNVFLAAFKAGVGLISNSIAVTLDAVNNLSDAFSSVITIVGMKLANKPSDEKHPLGYGRIEYFTSLIIAAIVISAGVTSLIESVKKIISPEAVSYSTYAFIIMVVAIIAKLILGAYTKKAGKQNNSDSLIASGADATFDAVVTLSTVISAVINIAFGLNIDGWLGAVIALIIIKSGIEMIMESISEMLGRRVDAELSNGIKRDIKAFDGVEGVYDLFLDNYGPENYIGFVHIEVLDTMSLTEVSTLIRKIQSAVSEKYGIYLTIGIYVINTMDKELAEIENGVRALFNSKKEVLQLHGLYIDRQNKVITFDIMPDFSVRDKLKYRNEAVKLAEERFDGYKCDIQIDTSISD